MPDFRRLDRESDSDSGVFSLQQIMHLMRVEFGRAQRYRYPIASLLVSVDGLGHLRDLYGYDAKEAVLDEVVRLLQQNSRSCDFLGRLNDDRFLVIVPHTGSEGTRVLADRMLGAIRALRFETEGKSLSISATVGGSHNQGGDTLFFDAMLAASEGALAEGQAAGGDRFVARDPTS